MRILNCRKFVLSQDEKMSYSSVGCVDLQEKLKLFLQEQQSGTLPSHVMRRKIELHTTPVKLSPIHQDSNLRFGSKIMLYNEKSKSFVCTDVDNKIHHFNQRFQVSASQLAQPIIRACFIVERFAHQSLHFSQFLMIECLQSWILSMLNKVKRIFFIMVRLLDLFFAQNFLRLL